MKEKSHALLNNGNYRQRKNREAELINKKDNFKSRIIVQ